jgi:hypothetical protein
MSHLDDLYQKAISAAWDKKNQAKAAKIGQSTGIVIPISSGKIKIKSIIFGHAEGAEIEKKPFMKKPYSDWGHANKAVREMAYYTSPLGGYDKTNFTIHWADGETYEGRIDINHKMTEEQRPLTDHVLYHLKWMAGQVSKPAHLNDADFKRVQDGIKAEHKAEAINFMQRYDLGQQSTVYAPTKPSGPTLREQGIAEDNRQQAAKKSTFDNYPSATTDRNETIAKVKAALQKRSSKQWSVTGGKGTAWGWIHISAPPKRLEGSMMTETDAKELARLLGLDSVQRQYHSVPASSAYRTEIVDRAEGRKPRTIGEPYWD